MKFQFLFFTASILFSSILVAEKPQSIPPVRIDQAEKHLADGAQLLDVRTKEEWAEGHIKGATLIPVTEEGFLKKAKSTIDSKKPVVVYCRSGKRSAMATKKLREAGFTVFDLKGGFTAWKNAGKECSSPSTTKG
ncbi:MAG: rhodanese-like domain-containing protein [Akkermansiaceae bacterium]